MRVDVNKKPIQVGQFMGDPTTLAISGASAQAGPLKSSTCYSLWANTDACFKWGDNTVAASANSHPLKAGLERLHFTGDAVNLYVAAVAITGTGVLYISELDVMSL